MNTFAIVICALLAAVNGAAIVEGPSSRTTILGADGSSIHSESASGVVAKDAAVVAPVAVAPAVRIETPVAVASPVVHAVETPIVTPTVKVATPVAVEAPVARVETPVVSSVAAAPIAVASIAKYELPYSVVAPTLKTLLPHPITYQTPVLRQFVGHPWVNPIVAPLENTVVAGRAGAVFGNTLHNGLYYY